MDFKTIIGSVSSNQRIKDLQNCKISSDFGKQPLVFNGEKRFYDVIEVPLHLLRFNTKNGRILMEIASLSEVTGERTLDADDIQSQELIFNALWNSNLERNEKTLKDLENKGQLVPGVITEDGVIIDGNRRASLLMRLAIENPTRKYTFKASKLSLRSNEENGKTLEAFEIEKQISEDSKLDYNPINKYIKVAKMSKDYGLTTSDLAELWGEKESEIKKWLDIKSNMDRYLKHINAPGNYKCLERMEDAFINFTKLWKKVEPFDSPGVTEEAELTAIDKMDLEKAYFDIIRFSYHNKGVNFKNFRSLFFTAHTQNGVQFLSKPELIKLFLNKYKEQVLPENKEFEEKISLTDLATIHPEKNKDELLKYKDEKWAANSKIENLLKEIQGRNEDENRSSKPEKTISEIFRKFESLLSISENDDISWKSNQIRRALLDYNEDIENTRFEARLIGKMSDFLKRNLK